LAENHSRPFCPGFAADAARRVSAKTLKGKAFFG
jgi:hypothetical protein